jgi:hypothetical protein
LALAPLRRAVQPKTATSEIPATHESAGGAPPWLHLFRRNGERMANLSLQEAFAIFGGKPTNRLHSLSAMTASGGEMILGCSSARFRHPTRGVLRYEDTLARDSTHPAEMQSLGQHLERARDGNLPIRMVVIAEKPDATGKVTREIHVRVDLIGKLIEFDGARFVIDFVRHVEPARSARR